MCPLPGRNPPSDCRGNQPLARTDQQLGSGRELIISTRPSHPRNFKSALDFVNRVIAEEQGHHPDLYLAWGQVEVKIWTHKINGLSESDFILAAKIDRAYTSVQ